MKFLIIQTAFLGDVVIATAIIEKLKKYYPDSSIDFLLRKGNEALLYDHPHVRKILIFDKQTRKYRNLRYMIRFIRSEKYDYVINVQRFFTTGLMTILSGAKHTIGYNKNPLSFFFDEKIVHEISASGTGKNEVQRNLDLIERITSTEFIKPRLYPTKADFTKVSRTDPYICIAPATVWYTKQFPEKKWIELIDLIPERFTILLLGGKADFDLCNEIKSKIENPLLRPALSHPSATAQQPSKIQNRNSKIENLAGQLSFLESAALMKNAKMNFVNDSAPLHFATAMNAPVTLIYCSTVPAFGFGPLSDISFIAEIDYNLYCRPCGLHGHKHCPEGHFKCAEIDVKKIIDKLF